MYRSILFLLLSRRVFTWGQADTWTDKNPFNCSYILGAVQVSRSPNAIDSTANFHFSVLLSVQTSLVSAKVQTQDLLL